MCYIINLANNAIIMLPKKYYYTIITRQEDGLGFNLHKIVGFIITATPIATQMETLDPASTRIS